MLKNGSYPKPPDPKTQVTQSYRNKTTGNPYITAEFTADKFDDYKTFPVGKDNVFANERRRRKRSGRTNVFYTVLNIQTSVPSFWERRSNNSGDPYRFEFFLILLPKFHSFLFPPKIYSKSMCFLLQ